MTQQCKCEHWQQCPVCMPHRFDTHGTLLPPEPTPLEACRAERDELKAELEKLCAVVLAERETCAKITDKFSKRGDDMGAIIAAAIRARGTAPEDKA